MAGPVQVISTATASPPEQRNRAAGFAHWATRLPSWLALLLVSAFANLAMNQAERSATAPYGQRVQTSHGALNVVRTPGNGRTGQSIVLLSGLGTPAPALDFAPLIRELGDYDVVVVEGFGYGYSDQAPVERTVENITTELHEALANADVPGPYVLAGHSIAGFYTLAYANRYRNDVSAVIGIDPMVPAARTMHADETSVPGRGINWEGMIATSGLLRWATMLAPGLIEPDGTAYTSRERDQISRLPIGTSATPPSSTRPTGSPTTHARCKECATRTTSPC